MPMVSTAGSRHFQLCVVMEGGKTVVCVLFYTFCNSFMISLTALLVVKIV
jgi:hypothetical protein